MLFEVFKERKKGREEKKENVSSYWMTLGKRGYTGS
jgi:hypothetical protein